MAAHNQGHVAPLAGLDDLLVTNDTCWFNEQARLKPALNLDALRRIERVESRALHIAGYQDIREEDDGSRKVRNLLVSKRGDAIVRPVFLPGYVSWEHEVEHHDQLTDIFSLGLIAASLACGFDFAEEEDLERFVDLRVNLFQVNPRLHQVVAKAISGMTEIRRHDRVPDLNGLIETLTNYRHQVAMPDLDFHRIAGFKEATHLDRSKIIQQRLRDRLFDISRRNRLLYFRPTLQMLNLTVASVPLMLDHKHIKPDALCTWQGEFAGTISEGGTVHLGKYLRFEDAPYLPSVLDQIRNQEARDRNEYGFSQLRLVLAFLRWHNLKEAKEERITSPLVLLPVALERQKGVRDSYKITPHSTEAEVNPVLRYHLKQLYGLQLPEIIDLSQASLDSFFEILQSQIHASEPGITLRRLDRPQVKLVHERARARVEVFRRRARLTGKGVRSLDGIDYSYSRDNFQPLGLQLFLKRVRPSPLPQQDVAGEAPRPRLLHIQPESPPSGAMRERDMYVLQEERESNPYVWDFDLCNLTLGNFNYRKMSLVRDYNTLLEGDFPNPAFDATFSLQPRKTEPTGNAVLPHEDAYQIVHSDPTQTTAVARARTGASFIIQGPPGTGKSQTITNLIADYVARGKRVLFVCEKRAAIDVVYHRLKQRGMDRLCCLIHDSQADKKAFILDLKQTYEKYLAEASALRVVREEREQVVKHLRFELDALERFSTAMGHADPRDGVPLRFVYNRLIELSDRLPEVTDADAERLPGYAAWGKFDKSVRSLSRILKEASGEEVFGNHALRDLAMPMIQADRPIEAITRSIDELGPLLDELHGKLGSCGLPGETLPSLEAVLEVVGYAERLKLLCDTGQGNLLNARDPAVQRLHAAVSDIRGLSGRLDKAAQKTTHWREKIPPDDLQAVLDQARDLEGSIFRFLLPSFWKLRGILKSRYDFPAHVVAPAWSRILADLKAEYDARDAHDEALGKARAQFKTDDLESLASLVEELHAAEPMLKPAMRALRERVLSNAVTAQELAAILGAGPVAKAMGQILGHLLVDHDKKKLARLADELAAMREALPVLPEILPVLTDLLTAPPDLYRALRERPWTPDELEAGILLAALLRAYRRDRSLPRTDGRVLSQHVERIRDHHNAWMGLNSRLILEGVHEHFVTKANLTSLPAAQLTTEQKELKKVYSKGRRELEHEFGKVMRYRSIRDLSDDETGVLVADLKPIWLMSPLSVSDTLPLTGTSFDVVIFDEASQIPLEEAVPALYRAPQIIVVGDEKQLPPTDFFSSKGEEAEEEPGADELPDALGYELSSDSFLSQSAENLPATMLCWHYRSRSESLISFSNSAFYSRKLLTVPDVALQTATQPILAASATAGDQHMSHVLDRPLSFHFMPNGVYRDRRNAGEAEYIARVVRGLLKEKVGLSIGIVAFSEAQQGEIEGAMNSLAGQDSEFDELLQAEMEREEDDQFCGLFVKNLENVQGDERDIIIMSVCYGHDANGKMLMNFGPINKRGGEKRLNVVFSRARRHMALVSSIKHTDITNDYNDGASCLKRYLAYAEALSGGQADLARRILGTFSTGAETDGRDATQQGLVSALAAALRERGYVVDLSVGDSDFRCDVAIRRPEDDRYRLGILIERANSAPQENVLEECVLRPAVLGAFDWQVLRVLAKDWHHDRDSVLAGIERTLSASVPLR
ncbi:MAG: hypothetical protein AMXMBFR7_43780 [Planctomycetota bacterium]